MTNAEYHLDLKTYHCVFQTNVLLSFQNKLSHNCHAINKCRTQEYTLKLELLF